MSLTILGIWTAWLGIGTLVLGPRLQRSRAVFFLAVSGNVFMCIGTALAWCAPRLAPMRVTPEGDVERLVPGRVGLAVVRCVQEGVRNALRDGLAKQVRVRLSLEAHTACLELEDDGAGLGTLRVRLPLSRDFQLLAPAPT